VPPPKRIATFDRDGTLWVEHLMCTFVAYCLERVPILVKPKSGLKEVEPFEAAIAIEGLLI
jgi:hypothetical protein